MRWVYFIKPVGLEGPIKIGISIKPLIRLEEFSACSPLPLEMIGFVPGTELDERFMHDCFADHHSHREWYRSSPKLRDAIASALQATRVDVLRGVLIPAQEHAVSIAATATAYVRSSPVSVVQHPRLS
jgi:hypothetical protein